MKNGCGFQPLDPTSCEKHSQCQVIHRNFNSYGELRQCDCSLFYLDGVRIRVTDVPNYPREDGGDDVGSLEEVVREVVKH